MLVADTTGVHDLGFLTAKCGNVAMAYLVSEECPEDTVGELGGPLGKASQVSSDVGGCLGHLSWVVLAWRVSFREQPSAATLVP